MRRTRSRHQAAEGMCPCLALKINVSPTLLCHRQVECQTKSEGAPATERGRGATEGSDDAHTILLYDVFSSFLTFVLSLFIFKVTIFELFKLFN